MRRGDHHRKECSRVLDSRQGNAVIPKALFCFLQYLINLLLTKFLHCLIVHFRQRLTCHSLQQLLFVALVVHIVLEVVIYLVLGVICEAGLGFVVSIAEVVAVARWLEVEAERIIWGVRAAIGCPN